MKPGSLKLKGRSRRGVISAIERWGEMLSIVYREAETASGGARIMRSIERYERALIREDRKWRKS